MMLFSGIQPFFRSTTTGSCDIPRFRCTCSLVLGAVARLPLRVRKRTVTPSRRRAWLDYTDPVTVGVPLGYIDRWRRVTQAVQLTRRNGVRDDALLRTPPHRP